MLCISVVTSIAKFGSNITKGYLYMIILFSSLVIILLFEYMLLSFLQYAMIFQKIRFACERRRKLFFMRKTLLFAYKVCVFLLFVIFLF